MHRSCTNLKPIVSLVVWENSTVVNLESLQSGGGPCEELESSGICRKQFDLNF